MPRASRWSDWVEPDRSPLNLVPIFGCKAFGRDTTCADVHPGLTDPATGVRDGQLPSGTNCCCMVCYESGREQHPALKETAAGLVRLRDWRPTDEAGNVVRDQWSGHDLAAAEPTVYDGRPRRASPPTRRQKRALEFGRDIVPMSPDQLAREADAGRARTIA